jgi:hypothetical protein
VQALENRVQFDLPPRSMERLNSGKQFLVGDENGVVSPYRLFL